MFKKIRKRTVVAIVLCMLLVLSLLLTWILSWFAPITILTPVFLINSRPELSKISKNLNLGQGFRYHISTPLIAHWGTPAWNENDMVYALNRLSQQAKAGNDVYYQLFSEEEIRADKNKEAVSLYKLSANNNEARPYVLLLAGGGFQSVCTPMESLPVAAAFNDMGYTAFCLTYRLSDAVGKQPDTIAEDIYKAVDFITAHAEQFNVLPNNYLIGGFSAGGVAISEWCNPETGYAKYKSEKPALACFIYGLNEDYKDLIDVPSYIIYCINDVYMKEDVFDNFNDGLIRRGIYTEYRKLNCLHGFGLGSGTEAEGWVAQAERLWKELP